MKRWLGFLCIAVLMWVAGCGPATTGSWTSTGSMSEPRSRAAAAVLLDGRVLVAGGVRGSGTTLSSAELYDPATGRWTATGSMSVAREYASATVLRDGTVLIAGGNGSGQAGMLDSAELFDPVTGTFTVLGPMAESRNQHTATLLDDGRVLLAGRWRITHLSGQTSWTDPIGPYAAEVFDPSTRTFSAVGQGLPQLELHTATLLEDGRVLLAGGNDSLAGGPSGYLFDPRDDSFSQTGPMIRPRVSASAIRLQDGRVLIAGGFGESGQLATAELYDPSTGTFSATGSMDSPRQDMAAALLRDGRVLFVGGTDSGASGSSQWRSSALVYDPSTGTFASAGSLARPLGKGSMFALSDGRVLVAGGDDGQQVFASCELFRP